MDLPDMMPNCLFENRLINLHVCHNFISDDVFHTFARDRCEAHWPIIIC